MEQEFKVCSKCGEKKEAEYFIKNKNQCKKCRSEYNKNNKEKNLKYSNKYRQTHPDEVRLSRKKWRQKTVGNKSYFREYRKKNSEKFNGYNRKTRQNLCDCYVISSIKKQFNISTETIRQRPELIEINRRIITNKRKVEQIKKLLK